MCRVFHIYFCVLFDIIIVLGLVIVRLGISCCLWYDVMHVLYVSHDAFNCVIF